MGFERTMDRIAIQALQARENSSRQAKSKTLLDALTGPRVPASERTLQRLKDEQQLMMSAGLETTAHFLTAMVCYMVTFPGVLQKLRAELGSMNKTKPTWSQLEALYHPVTRPSV